MMEARKNTYVSTGAAGAPNDTADAGSAEADNHQPGKLTFVENAILTIKLLGLLALIGVALWGINLWTAAK
jgi:hypothetical protein